MKKYVYYRVKKLADGRMYRYGSHGRSLYLIENELYTEKEYEKYSIPEKRTNLRMRPEWFEKIELTRKDVFWSFGARFQCAEEIN